MRSRPAHLGAHLVVDRPRRADGDLDLLRRALADGDAVLAADEGLDGGVDVEGADPHGLEGDDAAEGDERRLRGAAADVDDHVGRPARGSAAGADGRGHGLLEQLGVGGAGPRAASVTARRSTSVMADGTQITTRGRLKRLTPTRCSSRRIMRWVMSKSVMAPWRSGRTATM
jgi:hypothetical protein